MLRFRLSHAVPALPAPLVSDEYDADYITKNPGITDVGTDPKLASHAVNTQRTVYKHQGMKHEQGGWPENVDGAETDQVDRFLKKANKDPKYKTAVKNLGAVVETCVAVSAAAVRCCALRVERPSRSSLPAPTAASSKTAPSTSLRSTLRGRRRTIRRSRRRPRAWRCSGTQTR